MVEKDLDSKKEELSRSILEVESQRRELNQKENNLMRKSTEVNIESEKLARRKEEMHSLELELKSKSNEVEDKLMRLDRETVRAKQILQEDRDKLDSFRDALTLRELNLKEEIDKTTQEVEKSVSDMTKQRSAAEKSSERAAADLAEAKALHDQIAAGRRELELKESKLKQEYEAKFHLLSQVCL